MKKIVMVAFALAFLFSAAYARADETKVQASLKAWYNSWEEKDDVTNTTFDMGSSLMIGPAVNVRFANGVFIGAAYMKSTSDYESNDWIFYGDTMAFSREDIDLTAGYMFNPYFGAFIGYKSIEADAKYTYEPLGITDMSMGTLKLTGPGVGITANYPFNNTVAIYGSLALMQISLDFAPEGGTSSTDDLTGASLEVGLAFAFTENFSGNIGIKSQAFSGDDYTETFAGPTFGLNYTF